MKPTPVIVTAMLLTMTLPAFAGNKHYPSNRPPLAESAFTALPLGAVRPEGWLRDQLTVQANGLTGHLDEFWKSVSDSAWKGGDGDAWERGPYYLDGLVPLAYLLDDPRLKDKVKQWMEPILASGQDNGWFGPKKNNDRWPLAVGLKVLTQYYEATNDERALKIIHDYFRYLKDAPPDWPDKEWRGVRARENLVTAFWLYNRTGDKDVLAVARSIADNSFDWTKFFLDFPYDDEALARGIKYSHFCHVVNLAMAVKHPGVLYQLSKSDSDKKGSYAALEELDRYHGQVAGRFSGDEHLSGRRPTQGTELCAVVELMFSLEKLVESLGDPVFADRLELLAYNANPGACTADYWAHQYDQQANQVLCSDAKRQWSTNSDTSNLYGLEPHYGCCTANMHQGWPKFVPHMWMATPDNGLAAVALGPSRVTAKVGADGAEVTIIEETKYPFDGIVTFTMKMTGEHAFPFVTRIPGWATGATLEVDGKQSKPEPGAFTRIERTWKNGDAVTLTLPMNVRTERRYNDAVSILRGPLYYALKVGAEFHVLASHHDKLPVKDYEIRATTPWNYGLMLDPADPGKDVNVVTHEISKVPYANDAPPVVLKVKGRLIPDWKMEHNSAGDPPKSPVNSDEPIAELELVPYGSTQMRITEFPLLAK